VGLGANNYGQLGIGSTVDKWSPVQVSGLSNTVAAAGGAYHSLAVKADGDGLGVRMEYLWSAGDGTTTQRNAPVQVSGLTNVVAVAGSWYHSVAFEERWDGVDLGL